MLLAGDGAVPAAARLRAALPRCLVIGAVTLGVAAILVGLHHLTLRAPDLVSASSFADRSLGKAILETRFLPGWFYLHHQILADRFIWIVMAVGLLLALVRRRWLPAAMVLAISPLLFYRNAFPYFYVEMLAPAIILVALVVDEVRALARRGAAASPREWVPLACGLLLLVHGGSRLPLMSADEQLGQRRVCWEVAGFTRKATRRLPGSRRHGGEFPQGQFLHEHLGRRGVSAARCTFHGAGAACTPAAAAAHQSRLPGCAHAILERIDARRSRRAAAFLPAVLGADTRCGRQRDAGRW